MTSSINKRSSNIELLRILSMFLVLVLHSLFVVIGTPTQIQCINDPGNAFVRLFIQSLSIVAVNIFVLISGWFGIKPTLRKLLSLLFQVFFFAILIMIVFGCIQGFGSISIREVLKSLMITKGYWFIKSYLCLFILAPVLNIFAEKVDKRTYSLVLICFFVFQTIYGWSDSAPEFNYGCSVISFLGLYLLARYLRLYPIRQFSDRRLCLLAYLGLSLLLALGVWVLIRQDFYSEHSVSVAFSYINPLVVISSIALFFTFINTEIPYSKAINWIATSVFSVYIIHINGFVFRYFREGVWSLYSSYPIALRSLLILLFLMAVFTACVLLDKIRILVWGLLEKTFSKQS